MGFLHKLWDETLAGPAPESGLGKLRKYDSFSASSTSPISPPPPSISRSITIVRTSSDSRCFSNSASFPDSPPGPITPRAPSTPGTPVGDFKKFTRRKSPTQAGQPESTSPNISDWVIMSALDR